MFKEILKNNKEFFIATALYLLSIIVIAPWGNFAISDDFYYLFQVESFSQGILKKNALMGPTLILQSYMGLLWTQVFGHSYISVRILTILVSIGTVFATGKLFEQLKMRKEISLGAMLLVYFNQQFYPLSLTFMTENYFLLFIIASLYFYLLSIESKKTKHLLIASIIGGLSIMIRQYGVVLLITYLTIYLLYNRNKIEKEKLMAIILPFVGLGLLGIFYPRFKAESFAKSMDMSLFFTSFESFLRRLRNKEILPYIGFTLLPFLSALFIRFKLKEKLLVLIAAIPLVKVFFMMNIFNLGNLFYLERLYARHAIRLRENLFNNIPFKIAISYVLALTITVILLVILKSTFKTIKNKIQLKIDYVTATFLLLLIGFYTIVMITDRVFDRYLINFFIVLIIYAAYLFSKYRYKTNILFYLTFAFTTLITVFLTMDYYRENQLKWDMAERIVQETGVHRGEIFIDQRYSSTVFIEEGGDYQGLQKISHGNWERTCFVQEYIEEEKNWLNKMIDRVRYSKFVLGNFPHVPIDKAGMLSSEKNKFDETDILLFDETYYSPLYNILGKQPHVRGFCTT